MESYEIRQCFLNFYNKKGLKTVKSSPLVPEGDPSLLFTSAGMVQFKPYFLGLKTDLKRAASCQKCFRTTDIDNVGRTIRHLTFFEMLGNFSFGDYFKVESLEWGWEFLTKVLGLPAERMYPSVYGGGNAPKDDEAFAIWKKILPQNLHSHILFLGDSDNFWTMGDTGPCGPCSEIYWDRGEKYAHPGCEGPGKCSCDRYIEIWNHVFTQFDRQEDGTFRLLPHKNIDTGMGIERLAFIVENKETPFETSLFHPVVETAEKFFGKAYNESPETVSAYRIISEHLRASAFLISEGIIPSNEGRGYILRRLIRRASRYGRLLGAEAPFLNRLLPSVFRIYRDVYPELQEAEKQIGNTLLFEEQGFIETLNTGEKYLQDLMEKYPSGIPGKEAFRLYETYGFPFELTREIAQKKGVAVDEKGYNEARLEAQKIAKSGWKDSGEKNAMCFQKAEEKFPATVFTGYESLEEKSVILGLLDKEGNIVDTLPEGSEGYAVLDRTPCYAECGGQKGDLGSFLTDGVEIASITDTQKPAGDVYIHSVRVQQNLHTGMKITVGVSEDRYLTSCNHTAVHVINAALKQVFGETTRQAGSEVNATRFRFDYTINRTPTKKELARVEEIANMAILEGYSVWKEERPLADAKKLGATTLLGEKYADPARFVLINRNGFDNAADRYSLELCGGTHINNLKELISIQILRESSVSRGVRRIEGVSGYAAVRYLKGMARIATGLAARLSVPPSELEKRVEQLQEQIKELKQKKDRTASGSEPHGAKEEICDVKGVKLVCSGIDGAAIPELRSISDTLKNKYSEKAVFFLYSVAEGKVSFVVSCTKEMTGGSFSAASLVKELASAFGGRGGGRPDFAQGGCQAPENTETLTEKAKSLLESML
ncbi:MAG: alanine--tRNA ligase [Elusimicrobiales bacterium]|nr:alanine--tRNA ligase [Elusimicrobiales bacterium]